MKKKLYYLVAKHCLRKPEMAELLAARYDTLPAFLKASLNRACYHLRLNRIYALTSVTLELAAFCNLRCIMCPVNRGMKRRKGFMDLGLAKKILDENKTIDYVLLYHWGEPLLHPNWHDITQYAKSKGVRTYMTTNGTLLDNDNNISHLLVSGLDRLAISMDGCSDTYTRIRGFEYDKLRENIMSLIKERDRSGSALKVDLVMTLFEDSEKSADEFVESWQPHVDRIQMHPKVHLEGFNGVNPAQRTKRTVRCNEVWRGNLIVLWDGKVVPCCVDYEGYCVLGDASKQRLKEVVNGKRARELRRKLNKKVFQGICKHCSEYETTLVNPRFSE